MADDTVEVDELDRKILNALLDDGRKSFRKVAESVDSTPATVINRVEKLQDNGVITGYSADLDYTRLGYEAIAVIEVIVKVEHAQDVEEEIAEHNNVVSVYSVTGDTDVLAVVKFEDREDLTSFIQDELLDSDKVEKTITHMAFDIFKEGANPRFDV